MLEQVAHDGLAGWAAARLATQEQVAARPMTWLLGRLVYLDPPLGDENDVVARHVRDLLQEHEAAGELDLRLLWQSGWASPHGDALWRRYAADLLTCPTCLSWWTSLAVRAASGRFRPWRAVDWVGAFATWAVASQLARAPWNDGGTAYGPAEYLADALGRAQDAARPSARPAA